MIEIGRQYWGVLRMRLVFRRIRSMTKRRLIHWVARLEPMHYKRSRELIFWHFLLRSDLRHINLRGLAIAMRSLREQPARIIETGTSAWGTDSTRLWASYVDAFGGELWSVDIRSEAGSALGGLGPNVHLEVGDSVQFLETFRERSGVKVELAYLDSWDVDWSDPFPSAAHGLAEWRALQPLLRAGSIVVVDDTPVSERLIPADFRIRAEAFRREHGVLPGKGAFVLLDLLERSDVEVLYHHYNLVLRLSDGSLP